MEREEPMTALSQQIDQALALDPRSASAEIEGFISRKFHELNRHGLLIGLSGGLDSAIVAFLCARSVGREKLRLIYLPDRDSKPLHARHAHLVVEHLGVPFETRDITPILEAMGIYALLPTSRIPTRGLRSLLARLGKRLLGFHGGVSVLQARLQTLPDSYVSRGNAYAMSKHRLRMLLLYEMADVSSLVVVGAANKTELLTGTFSLWGVDHCADLMPVIHLYRSQLHALAAYLGIPQEIRQTPADPDLVPGVDDKGALLGSFFTADRILAGLELGLLRADLAREFGADPVKHIAGLYDLSMPMREIPYHL
jgi:NAD+ synthase